MALKLAVMALESAMDRAKATARFIGVVSSPKLVPSVKVPVRLVRAFQQPMIFAASSRFSSDSPPARPVCSVLVPHQATFARLTMRRSFSS